MAQLIPVARAARLVGIKRGTLQRKIRNGELSTFEGMVDLNELLREYPHTQIEDTSLLERMEKFIDRASRKARQTPSSLLDAQTLAARLAEVSRQLATAHSKVDKYSTIIKNIKEKLIDWEREAGSSADPHFLEFKSWLFNTLEKQLETPGAAEYLTVKDTFLRIMAAHVTIQPSGHAYFVEGNDTLLEAGLRAGLALDYGCSNGNCGMCKAKLLSGQVEKVRHHDYVLSEAEKTDGYILMCSNTAVTDVVLESSEAHSPADIAAQSIATVARRIECPNDNVTVLNLRTPRTNRLRFLAGQYVTAKINEGCTGDYAIASCPCDDMNLQLHVPRSPGDPFADYVFNMLRPSTTVTVEGPKGGFVLDEDSPRSLVFIAWGIGFAPIKSLIEHAMALDTAEDIYLYWVTGPETGHYMDNLCRSWMDALDNFHYLPLEAKQIEGVAGKRMMQQHLETIAGQIQEPDEFDFYIAGPEALTAQAHDSLLEYGFPAKQIFVAES
ncbi:MAG: 2Fe-2S iron-sulfur cluster binding domain-containing protein [Pseudomonadota bacterium]|nr:MAG: 2Fe-2S iron-sulfur cluster binding domain-containing protein [Pseudomonadota bacterium]